ncbi:MAG: DNA topoisomerase VI subunit B [Candidatus Lokiarchaeota archaeon]|nr:DNA topoisomerase VI subunit B [Candidatus Lokiarchaeota archaeon]
MASSKKSTESINNAKPRKPKKISTEDKSGDIKEASIAKFMRKRTQLVGFDYGNFKHTQYAVEFIDNALDAIEKFQWDAETNLETLKNNTASAITDFERFDNEAEALIAQVEHSEDQPVDALKTLYKTVPKILERIQQVNEEIQNLIGIAIRTVESPEKSQLKGSVTSTNFQEKYKAFLEEFGKIKTEYTNIIEKIDGMDKNPQFIFTLDKELSLENLNYLSNGVPKSTFKRKISDSLKKNLRKFVESTHNTTTSNESTDTEEESKTSVPQIDEIGNLEQTVDLEAIKQELSEQEAMDDEEVKELQKLQKKEKDLEVELQNIVDNLDQFVAPVTDIVDNEPLVILKLSEEEPPDVYREKGERSDSYLYTIEVFDNGTGMQPQDLMKFGKYLASSKSQKLRQTRGSQGFGSPSAFSDAQNTTGKPITAISKHSTQLYGVCSEFFTTEKNTKVYVVDPIEIETPFLHGTYVKLHYLNKKYNRGYVDAYIEKTALMNSHISFIYIDPYGEEHFYPRRVIYFPKEPKYALPHPSSIKIGDFQDLLRGSDNLTVQAFLTENFVRISSRLAKSILKTSELEIECKLRFFNLGIGFLSVISKPTDVMTYTREESRIYGRSKNPRMKYIAYLIENDLKEALWEPIQDFNTLMKNRHSLLKNQKSIEKSLNDPEKKKKELKQLEKELNKVNKELESIEKSIRKIKQNLNEILQTASLDNEIKHPQTLQKIEEIIGYLLISKTKPSELSQIQIEHLYMAFKNQSYLAPPTDTAIPVGESALETAVIKQYNLTVSNRVDYFGNSEDEIHQIGEYERIKSINKNLSKFNMPNLVSDNGIESLLTYNPTINPEIYADTISELDLVHTIGDDFIAANTRKPTSGKGLAFVVEGVMAYSPNKISLAKKASQVITRYVNRTPKMRDNADCALWQGVQSVNWKSYKVTDTFDNGVPKGNYVIYVNCSGPYTHLMFKSQSKNALAEDEVLIKEVKYCLEAIGRKLRKYMNKKEVREKRSKRSRIIEKNIPLFVNSIYTIAKTDPKYRDLKKSTLEQKINEVLAIETDPTATDEEIREAKKAVIPSPVLSKIISHSQSESSDQPPDDSKIVSVTPSPTKVSSSSTTPPPPVEAKTTLGSKLEAIPPKAESKGEKRSASSPEVTDERILDALSDNNWHPTSDIVKELSITTFYDARLLKIKLKALAMKERILFGKKQGKDVWRLK